MSSIKLNWFNYFPVHRASSSIPSHHFLLSASSLYKINSIIIKQYIFQYILTMSSALKGNKPANSSSSAITNKLDGEIQYRYPVYWYMHRILFKEGTYFWWAQLCVPSEFCLQFERFNWESPQQAYHKMYLNFPLCMLDSFFINSFVHLASIPVFNVKYECWLTGILWTALSKWHMCSPFVDVTKVWFN